MTESVVVPERGPPARAIAPCGPECLHASPLPLAFGDYVWCRRIGAPRHVGWAAVDCAYYSPRRFSQGDLP